MRVEQEPHGIHAIWINSSQIVLGQHKLKQQRLFILRSKNSVFKQVIQVDYNNNSELKRLKTHSQEVKQAMVCEKVTFSQLYRDSSRMKTITG